MFKSKCLTIFAAVSCLAMLLAAPVLGGEDAQSTTFGGPGTPWESTPERAVPPIELAAAREVHSDSYIQEYGEEIYLKHREVDQYLFGEYAGEIERRGFTVTHTAPGEGYIEIGITPFTQENAGFLYELFGKEMVQVIEGQLAELLPLINFTGEDPEPADSDATVSLDETRELHEEGQAEGLGEPELQSNGLESDAASSEDDRVPSASSMPLVYTFGALALVGGGVLVTRRMKHSKR